MVANDYKVRLETFEGPLDLLLFLIRRAEVDVADIPIATVTDQYLDHLEHLELIDIDTAGEFLLMATTLMEIKSRCLMPVEDQGPAPTIDGPKEDPRAELVRQLLEYKRFRDAADSLEAHRQEWSQRFTASRPAMDRPSAPDVDPETPLELEDLSVVDLVEAFGRIIDTVNFERLGEHEVILDDTPIELHAEDIVDRLGRDGGTQQSLPFRDVFEGRTRGEAIGLFLALLELCKQQRVRVTLEDDQPDQIVVQLREVADDALPPA